MRNKTTKNRMEKLIGREAERREIDRCLKSDRSELVIVYGRRRIGKTFLIEQHFNQTFDFGMSVIAESRQKSSYAGVVRV